MTSMKVSLTVSGTIAMLIGLSVLIAACAAPAAPAPAPAAGQKQAAPAPAPLTWRWAVNNSPQSDKGKMELTVVNQIQEKTKGRVKVEVFWEGSLGAEQQAAEGVQQKAVEMAIISTSNFSSFAAQWGALDLPFMVRGGWNGLEKFLAGPAIKELEAVAEKSNFKVISYVTEGWRHLMTTKKQVKVPADMTGMKLRTTASPVEAAYVTAFGANPSVVAWGEVYLALKQGIVDGYFISHSPVVTFKHADALKYCVELYTVPNVQLVVMGADTFKALPADLQQMVVDAGKEATKQNHKLIQEFDGAAKSTLATGGIAMYQPTEADLKLWRDATPSVFEKFQNLASKEWVEKAIASSQ